MFEFKVSLTEMEDGITESKFEIIIPKEETPTDKEVNDALIMLAVITVSSTFNEFFTKKQATQIYTEAERIGEELMSSDFDTRIEEIDVIVYPEPKGGIH